MMHLLELIHLPRHLVGHVRIEAAHLAEHRCIRREARQWLHHGIHGRWLLLWMGLRELVVARRGRVRVLAAIGIIAAVVVPIMGLASHVALPSSVVVVVAAAMLAAAIARLVEFVSPV